MCLTFYPGTHKPLTATFFVSFVLLLTKPIYVDYPHVMHAYTRERVSARRSIVFGGQAQQQVLLLLQLVLLSQLSPGTTALKFVVAPIHAISPTFDLMGVAAELQSRCVLLCAWSLRACAAHLCTCVVACNSCLQQVWLMATG